MELWIVWLIWHDLWPRFRLKTQQDHKLCLQSLGYSGTYYFKGGKFEESRDYRNHQSGEIPNHLH
jgi:hypothetical protein